MMALPHLRANPLIKWSGGKGHCESHMQGPWLCTTDTTLATTPQSSEATAVPLTEVNGSAGEASSPWKAAELSELHSDHLDTERMIT